MRAIVVKGTGGLSWQDVPSISTPGKRNHLSKVSAAGINRADLLQAAGMYPAPPGAIDILGLECPAWSPRSERG